MKTRLALAMEANGITMNDLKATIKTVVPYRLDDNDIDKIAGKYVTQGIKYPNIKMFIKIAKLCNCSLDYLVGLSDVMNPVGN